MLTVSVSTSWRTSCQLDRREDQHSPSGMSKRRYVFLSGTILSAHPAAIGERCRLLLASRSVSAAAGHQARLFSLQEPRPLALRRVFDFSCPDERSVRFVSRLMSAIETPLRTDNQRRKSVISIGQHRSDEGLPQTMASFCGISRFSPKGNFVAISRSNQVRQGYAASICSVASTVA